MIGIFTWNPRRKPFQKYLPEAILPRRLRVNNFGDLIGPLIVQKLVSQSSIQIVYPSSLKKCKRLFTVGSVLHYAVSGDSIWGSGRNGKILESAHEFQCLDCRAVRGPLTREFLYRKGVSCPETYGDPAILFPDFYPNCLVNITKKKFDILHIPNLNDYKRLRNVPNTMSPTSNFADIIMAISQSRKVVGSSLHGIIIAQSMGIEAVPIIGYSEPAYKYEDYFYGSGQHEFSIAMNYVEATKLAQKTLPSVNKQKLIEAFPSDIFV
jgi:pyruvyltransferase